MVVLMWWKVEGELFVWVVCCDCWVLRKVEGWL